MIFSLHWLNTCSHFSFKDNDDDDGEMNDLIAYFEQELTLESSFPKICIPELDLTQVHISGKK